MSSKIGLCFKNWFFLLVIALLFGMASPVLAQDDADEFTLEEITVTAEKREAELQKVPMDISVVRPEDMERLNIQEMSDLDKMMPDVDIRKQRGGEIVVELREVESGQFTNPSAETTVAVHVDGVQITRSDGLEGKLYDLERVETLKGPQGTLYGRGSTAGSMNLVSKKPDIGEFGGNITWERGSYNRNRIEGGLNIPATDSLAFRLSGHSITRDGFDVYNLTNQDIWGFRGSMRWEPTDTQSLIITLDTDKTTSRNGSGSGIMYDTFGNVEIVENTRITDPESPEYNAAMAPYAMGGRISSPYNIGWYTTDSGKQSYDSKSWGFNANYDNEFESAYLTVQVGYRSGVNKRLYAATEAPSLMPVGYELTEMYFPTNTYNSETGVYSAAVYDWSVAFQTVPRGTATLGDGWTLFPGKRFPAGGGAVGDAYPITELVLTPGSYDDALFSDLVTVTRMYSIESRITSKSTVAGGDKYEWLFGTLYMNDHVVEHVNIFENGMVQTDLEEYALFGQASYAPFARINFTGGYRYTWDAKTYHGGTTNGGWSSLENFWYEYAKEVDPAVFHTKTSRWDYGTYKANISWQATDDIMPYVQYSKGIKTGNVDRTDGTPIDPEELNAYEVGARTRLFDGKVQINATGYVYDTKNANEYHTIYDCVNGAQADHPELYEDPKPGICASENSTVTDVDYTFPDGEKRNRYTVINVGSAKQKGVNLNITWMATANDVFTLTGAYSSNRRVKYSVKQAMIAYAARMGWSYPESADQYVTDDSRNGQKFGGGLNGNVGYSHTWYIGQDFLGFSATGFYHGKGLNQIMRQDTDEEYRMPGNPAYWLVDASITYNSTKWVPEGYRWNLRLSGNNIFDKLITGRSFNDNSNWFEPGNGIVTYYFADPRQFALAFTLNF